MYSAQSKAFYFWQSPFFLFCFSFFSLPIPVTSNYRCKTMQVYFWILLAWTSHQTVFVTAKTQGFYSLPCFLQLRINSRFLVTTGNGSNKITMIQHITTVMKRWWTWSRRGYLTSFTATQFSTEYRGSLIVASTAAVPGAAELSLLKVFFCLSSYSHYY